MAKKALDTLIAIRNELMDPALDDAVHAVTIYNPAQEVESSLVTFVTYRLNRLQKALEFEDALKDTIYARIGEASFEQLIGLLEVIQKGNISITGTMLAPFVAQPGGKALPEVLRDNGKAEASAASQVYDSTDNKQLLQAMSSLNQFLEELKNKIALDADENNKEGQ